MTAPRKTIKRRKTRSDINPERLFARHHIAAKQAMGRSRLEVAEVASLALRDVMTQAPERIGPMAAEAMKDVVRAELARPVDSEAGTPEWVSVTLHGSKAREYVHISVAKEEALSDTVEIRNDQIDWVTAKVERLGEILSEVKAKGITAEEAVLSLWPDTETEEVEEYLATLELVLVERGYSTQ